MSYANIIGRNKEINILDRIYKSKKSELVAIYGRRRVGKSYLVSECFGKKILFKAVGTYIKDGDKDYESYRQLQLAHFYDSLVIAGLSTKESKPTCWREAFLLLRKVLEGKRKALIQDERQTKNCLVFSLSAPCHWTFGLVALGKPNRHENQKL